MEILCFSANVRQFNLTYSVVHVHLCFKSFLFAFHFLAGHTRQVIKGLKVIKSVDRQIDR